MDHVDALLKLPYETLALLASGYLSYRLAYTGKDAAHSTVDVIFTTCVFAFIAKLTTVFFALALPPQPEVLAWLLPPIVGLICALGAAALWSSHLQEVVYNRKRESGISDHDGQPNVWRSMLARRLAPPTRLVVTLKSGTELMCDQLAKFNDAPMGPCLFGEDGSVAMYVTDIHKPGATSWEEFEPYDPEFPAWGYSMSFIPASEIASIDVTRPV